MAIQEDTKDAIRQYYTASFDELTDMTDEFIAEDFVLQDPLVGEVRGHEELNEYYRQMVDGFSDPRIDVRNLIAEGELIAVHWTVRGTHDGEVLGAEPTGEEVTVTGVDLLRVEDGKIVEMLTYYDALGFMRQLGAIDIDEELLPAA